MSDAWTGTENFEYLREFKIYASRRKLLERKLYVDRDMAVFEAGSGPAHDSVVFAEKGARVTAFDQSETALRLGKSEYASLGLSLKTIHGDLKSIPVDDNQYDLVWNAGVLEHFKPGDDLHVLKEMMRITKPDGMVFSIVPNRFYFLYQLHLRRNRANRQYGYERAFTRCSLMRLFREAGLRDLHASGDFIHPDPSFLLPYTGTLSKIFRTTLSPLENSNRFDTVKSLIALEVAVWGRK